MTNPDTIRDALIAKSKLISSLVTLLGGDGANIEAYVEQENGDYFGTIISLDVNKMLVIYTGSSLVKTPRELYRHAFSLIFKTSTSSPGAILAAVASGIPTGSALPLTTLSLVAGCHPMEPPTMERRTIPIGEASSFDYWEIMTSFVDLSL